MNPDYIDYLRERQASTSIGASTARNMGPPGTIAAARDFLKNVDLQHFSKQRTEQGFARALDRTSGDLAASLPTNAKHWGAARKFLNIFLRGCSYNKYLNRHYKLRVVEKWFEVPLDGHVVTGLKREPYDVRLPRWRGVIYLTEDDSAAYQHFASMVAKKEGVKRVDLDVKYWRRVG